MKSMSIFGASLITSLAMAQSAGTTYSVAPAQTSERHRVKSLRIEVLSTMLSSGPGVGEWGFLAVVDVDGRRILFDTGGRPEAVLKNAKELHVDLSNIPDVIGVQVQSPDGSEDDIPEDMSLVFNTDGGLVILSGCGHSGFVNTIEFARNQVRKAPLVAAIGGFHLYELPDDRLEWTAGKLKEFGIQNCWVPTAPALRRCTGFVN
jgi:metal-dependent hydrolase (beta-lactamase superfamily II)